MARPDRNTPELLKAFAALNGHEDRNYLRLDCDCGHPIRAARRTFDLGGLACMVCGKFFTVTK